MKIFFFLCFLFCEYIYIYCEGTSVSKKVCFEYGCEVCDSEDYGSCTKCKEGFNLVQGTCPCFDFRCALCTNGLYANYDCQLCKKGYDNYNNQCTCDIDGCAVYENDKCLFCYDGYFYNSENNTCDPETDENRRICFDSNCKACLSEEKGTCEECKKGYKLVKGKCEQLPSPDSEGKCEDGYFINGEFCDKICDGLDCTKSYLNYYLCSINECLYCRNNIFHIFSSCDNSNECKEEGCLVCIPEQECLYCYQGYFLKNGVCKKCINGCSICADDNSCQYCFSGYKLTDDFKCEQIIPIELDFNFNLYNKKKYQLIKEKNPSEYDETIAERFSSVQECDVNCKICDDFTGKCKECKTLYALVDNTCEMNCSDENCLSCSIPVFSEQCDQCKEGYYARGKNCNLKCSDENCRSCKMIDDQEVCIECEVDYDLKGVSCKLRTNYMAIIYSIISFLILAIFIICFCWYKQKKIQEQQEILRDRITQANLQNLAIYSRNNNDESSSRKKLTKEEILEEFKKQKLKTEKGYQTCMFCKNKPGKYKCDCECIVCEEHSKLKKQEGDGEDYKVCFNCGKIVKKVTPIKQQCNICFEKKINLSHFKCNCALIVCKECYVKCKLESDKCPGCRAQI